MKTPDINMIKFFCATVLLIFGRRDTVGSSGHLQPYNAKQACDAIDHIAKRELEDAEDSL